MRAIVALALLVNSFQPSVALGQNAPVDLSNARSIKILGESYRRDGANTARIGAYGKVANTIGSPMFRFELSKMGNFPAKYTMFAVSVEEEVMKQFAVSAGAEIDEYLLKKIPVLDELGAEVRGGAVRSEELSVGFFVKQADPYVVLRSIIEDYQSSLEKGDHLKIRMIEDTRFRFITAEVEAGYFDGVFARNQSGGGKISVNAEDIGSADVSVDFNGTRLTDVSIEGSPPVAFKMNMLCWKNGKIVDQREHRLGSTGFGRRPGCLRKLF